MGDVIGKLCNLSHVAMQSWQFDDSDLSKLSALSRLEVLQLQFKGSLTAKGAERELLSCVQFAIRWFRRSP